MYSLLLANIERIVKLSSEEKDMITSHLQIKKVRRKQFLVVPHEYCRTEHFVNKGCFRAFYEDENHEHIVKFALEDWWITDIESFHCGTPATLYVEALEDGEVLALKKNDLEELYNKVPVLNQYFRVIYQNAIIAQNHRVLNNISSTVDERYLRFVQRYPHLEQRVPQYMIASYLGVTPEFLSKIKMRMALKRS